jgi:integrase/recombinase XerD
MSVTEQSGKAQSGDVQSGKAQSKREQSGNLATELKVYLDHLTVERGLAVNSLAAYQRDLSRYLRYLTARGYERLSDVVAADIDDYITVLRTGADSGAALSASSAARAVVAVRGWHKFAAQETGTTDVARTVRPPAGAKHLPHTLTISEVTALLAAAGHGDGPAALRDRALLELLYSTGARISEAVGLDLDDLDLAEAPAVLLRGKGSRERIVPIGSYAVTALEAYLVRARPALAVKGRGTPAVFLNLRGGRLSRQSAWTIIGTAAERAGLDQTVSPHTLRHTFATHLLAGGADVRVVQELLGHASVTTTQIYTHLTADTLREVYVTSHPRALEK